MVSEAKPRTMTPIGKMFGECETLGIFSLGSVRNIWVYSDETGIVSLAFELSNGSMHDYGREDREGLTAQKFPFSEDKQLLGLFADVEYTPGDPDSERLLTLGFFKNECSDSAQLFMTDERQREFMKRHVKDGLGLGVRKDEGGRRPGSSTKVLVIILGIISAVSLTVCTVTCIRSRCYKKRHLSIEINGDSGPH